MTQEANAQLIETIRAALAAEAAPEARAEGIAACRSVLAALGAEARDPDAAAPPKIDVGPTAAAIAALVRSTPPDQLLDLVIGRLRALVPAEQQHQAAPHTRFNVPLVKVPR
ncbi:MAG: hypothetical protein KIT31_16205 [Deltaproteobacteria bacterium]|nr:hypothetical protein [Deltaproteobacteria bacterium]